MINPGISALLRTTKPIAPFSCTPRVQEEYTKAEVVHLTPRVQEVQIKAEVVLRVVVREIHL